MRSPALLLILLSTLASGQQTPSERHAPIFGTYSSLAFNDEGGDVVGTEIQIIPQYMRARVLFQCAEGVPSRPILVPAEVTPKTVDFDIPASPDAMCPGRYHGQLTDKGLELSLDGKTPELLPRTKSYWAR